MASAAASASASASASLAPGQSPPFFTVTPTDQAGVIVIVTALCIAIGLISTLVRAYVRFGITSQEPAVDDGIVAAAMGFCVVQGALVLYQAHHGFGVTIGDLKIGQIDRIQQAQYAADLFYIISVWLSKVSTTFLLLRLSPKKSHRKVNFGVIGLIGVTVIAAILTITIRCDLSHPWYYYNLHGTTCSALVPHWGAIAALDIFTELVLVATSVHLVWSLQMDVSKKAAVVFAFMTRLATVVPVGMRLRYLSSALVSRDPTLHAVPLIICTQVEIAVALSVASVPTLRPFMLATATHYGAPAEGPKSHSGTHESFTLRNLASRMRKSRHASNNDSQLRTEGGYDDEQEKQTVDTVRSYANGNADDNVARDTNTSRSDDSKEMIIRKDVRYAVEYGDQA